MSRRHVHLLLCIACICYVWSCSHRWHLLEPHRTAHAGTETAAWPDDSAPPAPSERMPLGSPILPGEYEAVDFLMVGWNQDLETFLLDIVEAAWDHTQVVVLLAADDDRADVARALSERGLDPDNAWFVPGPIESPWIRDYGPLVVQYPSGERSIVDPVYQADQSEDRVPQVLGAALWRDWYVRQLPIQLEGGNLLSDGRGRCFTTLGYEGAEQVMQESLPAIDQRALRDGLRDALGCRELFQLPPLANEPTHHVDMYLTIVGEGQALLGQYDAGDDPDNAATLDQVAQTLRGAGMNVRRIPMPDSGDGHVRSYTNSLAVNGVVLVPVYPEADAAEEQALAVFREAYPDREIIPIVATDAIDLEGAVHCTTMTVAHGRARASK